MKPHDPIKAWTETMRNMETKDLKRLVRVMTAELMQRNKARKLKAATVAPTATNRAAPSNTCGSSR